MKKTVRPLRIGRETLLHLGQGRVAVGGAAVGVATLSQEGASCLQSCYFNTCYDTCQWEANGLA
jgi:hypothetical protein